MSYLGGKSTLWLAIFLSTKGWEQKAQAKLNLVWGEKQEFSVGLIRFRSELISVKPLSKNPFNISLPDIKMFAVSSCKFSHFI